MAQSCISKTTRVCPTCNELFAPVDTRRVYCSRKCFGLAMRIQKERICCGCGTQFFRRPSGLRGDRGKYCSRTCRSLAERTRKECICRVCEAKFFKVPSAIENGGGKYCSRACYGIAKCTLDPISHFWAGVDMSGGPNACWPWMRAVTKHGYGHFSHLQKDTPAHRRSYELTYGPIPERLFVLHSCDVKLCVNPRHLHTGTQAQNIREAVDRGRMKCGERHGNAKLTETEVRKMFDMKQQGKSLREIALNFNVTKPTICNILNHKTWKHIID